MAKLDETFETLHSTIPLIADQVTRPDAARPFTQAFYTLYLAQAAGLSTQDKDALERFLTGSAEILEPAMPFLDYNLCDRIEARLTAGAQAEDWPIICELRSTLEGLKELYGPHLPMDELIPDDEELDTTLKERAGGDGAKGKNPAPKGVPESHWWWALQQG